MANRGGHTNRHRRQNCRGWRSVFNICPASISLCQRSNGRTVYHMAIRLKAGAMTWAIPGPFNRVPLNDATEMRTERRTFMQDAIVITMHGDFRKAPPDDGAFARSDLRDLVDLAGCDEIRILGGDVEVFFRKFLRRPKSLTGRVVQLFPWVCTTDDEIREQHTRNRAVRHAIARISGRDVDVIAVERITADQREAVDWFHHLT